jgi:hypothetical protein
MKAEKPWELFAIFCFIVHTLCLVELIDVLLFKRPFMTFFLIIFAGCYSINRKIYKKYFGKKDREIVNEINLDFVE